MAIVGSELYTCFARKRATTHLERAGPFRGAYGPEARLLDELVTMRGIGDDWRAKMDVANSLSPVGSGERARVNFPRLTPEAIRLAAAWPPTEILRWLEVFVDLNATPKDLESVFVATRALSTLALEDCNKSPKRA